MSRLGSRSIKLSNNLSVDLLDNNVLKVKGLKGELAKVFPSIVKFVKQDDEVKLEIVSQNKKDNSRLLGLYRSLLNNMIMGVTCGFEKNLELVGVGYRVQLSGKNLIFTLGYSHEVVFEAKDGITYKVEGQNKVIIEGIDKELIGQTAAEIRYLRLPELYKGKGIRFKDEIIILKPGKSAKK